MPVEEAKGGSNALREVRSSVDAVVPGRGEMTDPPAEGPCIVCGHRTTSKSYGGGFRGARRHSHWRCADGEECAVRRNARKRRPRPETEVRAEWRARHLGDRGRETAT